MRRDTAREHRTSPIGRLAVLVASLSAVAAGAVGGQQADHAFLTSARLWPGGEGLVGTPAVPDDAQVEFGWSDRPLVVHVPFLIADAGAQQVTVWLQSADLPDATALAHATLGLSWLAGDAWDPALLIDGAPVIRLSGPRGRTNGITALADSAGTAASLRPRTGVSLQPEGAAPSVTITIPETAPRGPWALWVAIPPAALWPDLGPAPRPASAAGVDARITAQIVVADLGAAGGGTPSRQEIVLRSRRNGWVLDTGAVVPAFDPTLPGVRTEATAIDGVFAASLSVAEGGNTLDSSYRIELPPRIDDGSLVDVAVSGRVQASSSAVPVGWRVDLADARAAAFAAPNDLDASAHHLVTLIQPTVASVTTGATLTRAEFEQRHPELGAAWIEPASWPATTAAGSREGLYRLYSPPPVFSVDPISSASLFEIAMTGVAWGRQVYVRRSEIESSASGVDHVAAFLASFDPGVINVRPVPPPPLDFDAPIGAGGQPAAVNTVARGVAGAVAAGTPPGSAPASAARAAGGVGGGSARAAGGVIPGGGMTSNIWIYALLALIFVGCTGLIAAIVVVARTPAGVASSPAGASAGRRRRVVHLEVRYPDGTGKNGAIDVAQKVLVGRASDAGLRLNDDTISGRHAQIVWSQGHVMITDLGSANGTVVDGMRIRRAALKPGMEILLGSVRVRVDRIE